MSLTFNLMSKNLMFWKLIAPSPDVTQDAPLLNLSSVLRKWDVTVFLQVVLTIVFIVSRYLFNLFSLHLLTFSNVPSLRALPRWFDCWTFICSVVIVMVDFSSEFISDMAAKGAKEALVNKLGFKSSSKSAEMELKRENEQLKRSLEQMKRNGKHSDPDRAKLLEVIFMSFSLHLYVIRIMYKRFSHLYHVYLPNSSFYWCLQFDHLIDQTGEY